MKTFILKKNFVKKEESKEKDRKSIMANLLTHLHGVPTVGLEKKATQLLSMVLRRLDLL